MSEKDDLDTWLRAIHQAIKEHSESVTKYQQAETSQREQQAQTELKTVVRLPIEVTEYYRSEHGDRPIKNKREKIRLAVEITGVIVALVLVILTFCTFLVFNGQLREMQKQTKFLNQQAIQSAQDSQRQLDLSGQQVTAAQNGVDAIRRQMRQDQRAWIKMEITDKLAFNENRPFITNLYVENIGKTAATKLVTMVVVEKLAINVGSSLSFRKGIVRAVETTGVLFPKDPSMTFEIAWVRRKPGGKDSEIEPIFLSSADAQELAQGKAYFSIYARTKYVDIFGTTHVTHFCTYVAPTHKPVVVTAKKCTDYNSVDNN